MAGKRAGAGWVALWGALFAWGACGGPQAQEPGRGVRVAVRSPSATSSVGRQWLVLVAVDRYSHWPPLRHPVADAKEVRDILLSRYFFDPECVLELYDERATKKAILELFAKLKAQARPADSVLLFYAGHGQLDKGTDTGFWIPVDGGSDAVEQANWLPNVQVRGFVKNLDARHVCLIADSCFSGDILNPQRGPLPEIDDGYFRRAYEGVSRQALTSGASEAVPDQSEFALQLKLALKGNERPYLDPLQIFAELRTGVRQTQPMLGDFKESGHQAGASYLLFLRPGSEGVPPAAPAGREEVARQAYDAAEKANTEAAWREVVTSYEGTTWGENAKDKLFKLEQGRRETDAGAARKAKEAAEAARKVRQANIADNWETTERTDTGEAYSAFVERYKTEPLASGYVKAANQKMGELNRLASAKPDPGPEPEVVSIRPDAPRDPAAGTRWTDPATGVELVWVPAESFTMGSDSGDSDERPAHRVTISKGFWMGRTEVTVGQFRKFVGEAGYRTEAENGDGAYAYSGGSWVKKPDASWKNPYFSQTDEGPVTCVSWNDARAYIEWLNRKAQGGAYRLPTEAEWEHACRAGTAGDRYGETDAVAWYDSNSGNATHIVGQKKPNAWGLYDMLGNVWEWCSDYYDSGYYGKSPSTDPAGPSTGAARVGRGGSWSGYAGRVRCASRGWSTPSYRYDSLGFRLARDQP